MRRIAVAGLALVFAARQSGAQAAPPTLPELRADLITRASGTSLQVGGGFQFPMGYYVRLGAGAGLGVDVGGNSARRGGRADFLARFLFDPFRQQRWGVSAGGGISVLANQGDVVHPVLLAAIDLEGPRSAGGFEPAFQLGLGGGIRLGAIFRWGAARTR